MTGPLVAGLLAGYGIAVPVGAVASYLVVLTARTSWRVGAAAGLGVATADGVYALVAAVGGASLTVALQAIAAPLRLACAAVLLILAVQVARAGLRDTTTGHGGAQPTPVAAAQAYRRLVAITVVNPTTAVYFVALVVGEAGGGLTSPASRLVFVGAAAGASASWQLLLVSGGTLLGRTITSSRGQLGTALGSSAIIAFLAVRTVLG